MQNLCTQVKNNGVSIWLFRDKELSHVCDQPKGIPRLRASNTYVVINQKLESFVMCDAPKNKYSIFFWIGAHCDNYDLNYEQVLHQINQMSKAVP